ncbi:MAG TPA: hypothetical protein PKI05_02070 [Thermogutta sp.]|nr:hypothetical protein [Thermogutta sp.]HOP76608.1 hypothetical protein [Thermogutta sp.]HPU06278.1 hypothetical protein [Thermogutta sp.]HPZ82018.1 hypothetical protein [Thermogutta sp.]HQF14317.1 hypothetical protein [Thermogutta sp.]
MSDDVTFDPYRKWLGIPPEEQPPNYYRLLGIAPFESDPDVIVNAADRQMGHVRRFQAGRYAQVCQKILNELAAARVCLLDPVRKRAYDQKLFFEFRAAGRELPFPVATPLAQREIPPPWGSEGVPATSGGSFSAVGEKGGAIAGPSVLSLYRRRRKSIWRDPTTAILLTVLFLMVVVVAILVIFRQHFLG